MKKLVLSSLLTLSSQAQASTDDFLATLGNTQPVVSSGKVLSVIEAPKLQTQAPKRQENADFLVDFFVNDEKKGEFALFFKQRQFFAEKGLFEAAGIPAASDLPLEKLRNFGSFSFNKQAQVVSFEPNFQHEPKREEKKVIEAKASSYAFKAVDYSLRYEKRGDEAKPFGTLTAMNFAKGYDVDLTLSNDPNSSNLFIDTNFNKPWLKNAFATIGQNQSVYLTNVEQSARASFDKAEIVLNFPLNSIIQVFKNGRFERSFRAETRPQKIQEEISYGETELVFKAITPAGDMLTKTKSFSIKSQLTKIGKFDYSLYAQNSENGQVVNARLSYGFSQNMSFFAQKQAESVFTGKRLIQH